MSDEESKSGGNNLIIVAGYYVINKNKVKECLCYMKQYFILSTST